MYAAILYGGITHHYIGSKFNYCNRIDNNNFGTINNEYFIAMVGSKDSKVGVIKGKDSACGNIFGAITSNSLSENVDFILGGYNANIEKFQKRGLVPPNVNGVTPVVGFNFKMPIHETPTYKISINNVVSYGIITHSLGIEF